MGITTRHVGNEGREWRPGNVRSRDDLQVEDGEEDYDNDEEERRDAFVDYLEEMMQEIDDNDNGKVNDTVVDKAMAKKRVWAVIQALRDPVIQLPDEETNNVAIWQKMDSLVNSIDFAWTGISIDGEEEEGEPRKIDTDRNVTAWYGGRCPLTIEAVGSSAAALLVPQFVVQSALKLSLTATGFNELWGEGTVGGVASIAGKQTVNTLPLGSTALKLWDRYMFALRPIEDPDRPLHNIYLQVVWLLPDPQTIGIPQGLADGDIIHLRTSDPEQHPLPSLPLLQMQCRARQIVAGIRTPSILREIFRGNPDGNIVEELDDDEDIDVEAYGEAEEVPLDWQSLLKAAETTGVLSNALVDRWGKAILRKEQRDYRRAAHASRKKMAE
ncbi:hypothetical protein Sste5346_008048 [Sporothrix stenoceras]|uniref:Uncharacterized protein n=1 Tax=Sporothrix stenoceras TaxID=5173 RepID=A0ABR3YQT2_9PEZI